MVLISNNVVLALENHTPLKPAIASLAVKSEFFSTQITSITPRCAARERRYPLRKLHARPSRLARAICPAPFSMAGCASGANNLARLLHRRATNALTKNHRSAVLRRCQVTLPPSERAVITTVIGNTPVVEDGSAITAAAIPSPIGLTPDLIQHQRGLCGNGHNPVYHALLYRLCVHCQLWRPACPTAAGQCWLSRRSGTRTSFPPLVFPNAKVSVHRGRHRATLCTPAPVVRATTTKTHRPPTDPMRTRTKLEVALRARARHASAFRSQSPIPKLGRVSRRPRKLCARQGFAIDTACQPTSVHA